ncbi:PP2C family serine/threonine-protein phosphatase [Cupriavidus pauculus]|uniref:PP2C family protein-serine/threonine phosphatase n=1 Tax=Cupriavidus pauculus TaxID=82633 RepID=UPI0030FB22B6
MEQFRTSLTAWLLRKTAGAAVRRVGESSIAITTDVGVTRQENQDRVAVLKGADPNGRRYFVIALCDGMGGMADGAICGATALAGFLATFAENHSSALALSERLRYAAYEANRIVFDIYRSRGGATLSAILLHEPGKLYWVNVGDSRIYRKTLNEMEQLTVDDTLEGQLPHGGSFGARNQLLQFIGVGPDLEVHIGMLEYQDADQVLLSSDGLHGLPKDFLAEILANSPDLGVGIKRLVDIARWRGGHDNASGAVLSPLEAMKQLALGEGEPSVLEFWDPYGELHMVSVRQVKVVERPSSERDGKEPPVAEGSRGLSPPPAAKQPRTRKQRDPNAPKKDRAVKVPKATKQAAQVQTESGAIPEDAEKPQLIIEFQNNEKK